jgi:hypothetical protein
MNTDIRHPAQPRRPPAQPRRPLNVNIIYMYKRIETEMCVLIPTTLKPIFK